MRIPLRAGASRRRIAARRRVLIPGAAMAAPGEVTINDDSRAGSKALIGAAAVFTAFALDPLAYSFIVDVHAEAGFQTEARDRVAVRFALPAVVMVVELQPFVVQHVFDSIQPVQGILGVLAGPGITPLGPGSTKREPGPACINPCLPHPVSGCR